MLARLVQDGPLAMPVEVSSDCRSLFDMIVAGVQGKAPSEGTLVYPVDHLRQDSRIEGILHAFYWIDTRDCVADGLTKGCVARYAILQLLQTSAWKLEHPCQRFCRETGRSTLPV